MKVPGDSSTFRTDRIIGRRRDSRQHPVLAAMWAASIGISRLAVAGKAKAALREICDSMIELETASPTAIFSSVITRSTFSSWTVTSRIIHRQ